MGRAAAAASWLKGLLIPAIRVKQPGTGAQVVARRCCDGSGDEVLGLGDRFDKRPTRGLASRDRGGKDAPPAMKFADVQALRGKTCDATGIDEQVVTLPPRAVSPFDQHGLDPHRQQRPGLGDHRSLALGNWRAGLACLEAIQNLAVVNQHSGVTR